MKQMNALRLMMLMSVALTAPAWAEKKDIELNEYNDLPDVRLELAMELREGEKVVPHTAEQDSESLQLKVGDELRICLESNSDGYVTLWQRRLNDMGAVETKKIYPTGDGAEKVVAEQRVCPGSTETHWGFRVKGASKSAEIIAHWTRTEEAAWSDSAYPKAVKRARSAESPAADSYASRTLRYNATED